MPNLTAADLASRKGWVKKASDDGDEDLGEKFSGAANGRSRGARALYNATRGDTMLDMATGKQASEKKMKRMMDADADEAETISRSVPRRKSPLYERDEED